MPDPLLALLGERSALLREIAELGDFQPGSITIVARSLRQHRCRRNRFAMLLNARRDCEARRAGFTSSREKGFHPLCGFRGMQSETA
jgi:hypothetical protein